MSPETVDSLLAIVLFMLSVIGIIMGGMILTGIIGNICLAIHDRRAAARALKPKDHGTYLIIGRRTEVITGELKRTVDTRTQWERDRDEALAELNRELDA